MSIQLASPIMESGPGITTINDAYVTIETISIDSPSNSLQLAFRYGTATIASGKTTAFVPDPNYGTLSIVFSIGPNTWTASNGMSGAMSPSEVTQITALISTGLTSIRDAGEMFAFNHAIFGAGATNFPW